MTNVGKLDTLPEVLRRVQELENELATTQEQLQTTHQQVAEVARDIDPDVTSDAWGLHAAVLNARAELERERDAREKAEAQWNDDERDLQAHCAGLKARVEQAEKERDEAKTECERLRRLALESDEARERAEADNAEVTGLLVQLFPKEHRDTWIVWLHEDGCRAARDDYAECRCDGEAYEERIRTAIEDHPGAALLDRVRALEAVREACEPSRRGIAADVAAGSGGGLSENEHYSTPAPPPTR